MSLSPAKAVGIALGILCLGVGLNFVRLNAHGWKNAISPKYWSERFGAADLYNPSNAILKRGPRELPIVCLTIDDGPHTSLPLILRTLKATHVKATFFVVGIRVKEHPEFVRQILADGHEVGNHTQDHLRLDNLTLPQVQRELENCSKNVDRASGYEMKLMRPPGMRFTQPILLLAKKMGYVTVGWTVGAKDFVPTIKTGGPTAEQELALESTPEIVAHRVLQNVENGSIILLHDSPMTAKALPKIIEGVKAKGLSFVTVAQMLAQLPHPVVIQANPRSKKALSAVTSHA